jgi:hypothetical protein
MTRGPRWWSVRRQLFLLGLSATLVVLSCVVHGARSRWYSLGWTTVVLRNIELDSGLAYTALTNHFELSERIESSPGEVLENGVPLPGDKGALHADIRSMGRGRSSFWGRYVLFASSDNTPPTTNGRVYQIRYPTYVTDPYAYALYLATLLALGLTFWLARPGPGLLSFPDRLTRRQGLSAAGVLLGLSGLAAGLFVVISLNRGGLLPLGTSTFDLETIRHDTGFAYVSLTHRPELATGLETSTGVVLEDGRPLSGAGDDLDAEIRKEGRGRYAFSSYFVRFAASDNSSPLVNGRKYSVRCERTAPLSLERSCLAAALALFAAVGWLFWRTPELRLAVSEFVHLDFRREFVGLLWATAFFVALAWAAFANRRGLPTFGWGHAQLRHLHHEIGFGYRSRTYHPELSAEDKPSLGILLEDGVPYPHSLNAGHSQIRTLGAGRYSFWSEFVYFSARDNSDPERNGRTYSISFPRYIDAFLARLIYAVGFLLCCATFYFARRIPPLADNAKEHALVRFFTGGPPFRGFVPLLAVSAVLSILGFLNLKGFVFLGWRSERMSNIQHEREHAYVVSTGRPELASEHVPPFGQVWEDGVQLPSVLDVRLDDIRLIGKGRYLFLGDDLFFSAPDNSSPETNGRRYELRSPISISATVEFLLCTVTGLLIGYAVCGFWASPAQRKLLRPALRFLANPPFYLPAAIVFLLFAISRLPFFCYYAVPTIEPDSASYLYLVAILRGHYWLYFDVRTPGYPLLVWPFTYLSDQFLPVVYAQCILSLLASLAVVLSIHRIRPSLSLLVAVAMGAFLSGSQETMYDTAVLSESLYTTTIVLSVALLFLGLISGKGCYLAGSSAVMGYAIWTRPAGLYFVIIYAIVLGYLLWNRYRRKAIVSFMLPLPILLLSLSTYNLYTIKSFVVSPFGEANLAGATLLFWEPDPSLPPEVNEAVKDLPNAYAAAGITAADFEVLRRSWNPWKLLEVFDKQYNKLVWGAGYGSGKRFSHKGYLYYRKYIRQVSLAAIRHHPLIYLKYVWTNLAIFYNNLNSRYEYYTELGSSVKAIYVDKTTVYEVIPSVDVHVEPPLPADVHILRSASDSEIALAPHYLTRVHVAWEQVHWELFLSRWWLVAYVGIFAAGVLRLCQSRGHNLEAFMIVTLCLLVLGAGLVVALVEIAMSRYSYPTQFVFYLVVALSPALLKSSPRPRDTGGGSRASPAGGEPFRAPGGAIPD